MPHMELSETEAQTINHTRREERERALGYNEAMTSLIAHCNLPADTTWEQAKQHLLTWAKESQRHIQ